MTKKEKKTEKKEQPIGQSSTGTPETQTKPIESKQDEGRPGPEPDKNPEKTLNVTSGEDLKKKVSDVELIGNPDTFQLISKASSKEQGWMKSTKALEVPGQGCIVQVTTQQKNPDGTYAVAEALTYVPGVKLGKSAEGKKIVQI